MKKMILLLSLIILFGFCLIYNEEIVAFVVNNFIQTNHESTLLENNSYAGSKDYDFVQITNSFEPQNRQDILNIYYTVLNSGMDKFTFYCPTEYKGCLSEVDNISKDRTLLSNINNYVPIYNSFQNIETEFDTLGKVDIIISHSYSKEQIQELENITDEIMKSTITSDMTIENKIKVIHDYIINKTTYDKDRSDNKVNSYNSDTAYGALIQHYAICGGYADSIKLFLDKLGVDNYKISSENHIWNLVYLNNNWYHLDLTWDDPVTKTGEDVLEYDYFLITTDELLALKTDQHFFDTTIYTETN